MSKKKVDTRKIWLVPHPTAQYVEDVKELAQVNRLRVVDANVCEPKCRGGFEFDPKFVEQDPPELTVKKDFTMQAQKMAEDAAQQSVSDAQKQSEEEANAEAANIIAKAEEQAKQTIADAQKQAEEQAQATIADAQKQAGEIVQQATKATAGKATAKK